jgi:hypothetical protein
MELKALLHKLQVVGRKVADGAREPGEILKFEQLQTREPHGLFYLLSCGHLAPIHRGCVSQDEVPDALHGPAEITRYLGQIRRMAFIPDNEFWQTYQDSPRRNSSERTKLLSLHSIYYSRNSD